MLTMLRLQVVVQEHGAIGLPFQKGAGLSDTLAGHELRER